MEFSYEDLEGACKSYRKLCRALEGVSRGTFTREQLEQMPIAQRMIAFLADDLNTTGMFGVVFESLDMLKQDQQQAAAVKQILHDILGLPVQIVPEKKQGITPEIEALLAQRQEARSKKNWKRADEMRDQLKALGYEVRDKKGD